MEAPVRLVRHTLITYKHHEHHIQKDDVTLLTALAPKDDVTRLPQQFYGQQNIRSNDDKAHKALTDR